MVGKYINTKTPMEYICSCGNISKISLSNFLSGYNCSLCGGNKKYTRKKVNEIFKDGGCVLLDSYVNNKKPLKYKCVCGNISKISLSNFKRGGRCQNCKSIKYKKRRGSKSPNWNPNREEIVFNRRFRNKMSNMVHRTLSYSGNKKTNSTESLLNYKKEQLLKHLKEDKKYEEWKENPKDWHIDHIIPVKVFIDNDIFDPSIINALINLRIIYKKKNWEKNDNYDQKEFISFINNFRKGRDDNGE